MEHLVISIDGDDTHIHVVEKWAQMKLCIPEGVSWFMISNHLHVVRDLGPD